MAESGEVCNFFRKPTKNKSIRKRRAAVSDDEDAATDDAPSSAAATTTKSKKSADNKLLFSSSSSSKRSADDGVSGDPDEAAGEPRPGALFYFESSKEIQVQHDSRATATLETETEFSKDARAIRERVLKQAEKALKGKPKAGSGSDEVYKGIHGYTDFKAGFRREQTVASEKAGGAHGPLRASAHIRMSARFDYQPDICKDYKETGYCGYGDSCKFMHDRGDYKSGWQLEKEWEEVEKARKRGLAAGGGGGDGDADDHEGDDEDDDTLPFACFI